MNPNLIIADDHDLMLEGIRTLLERSEDYTIVATARNGPEALEIIVGHQPDIAVLDASMPEYGGVEVVRRARAAQVSTETFVILSMFHHPHLIAEARDAGASACVSKNDTARELLEAIGEATRGRFFVSTTMRVEWDDSGLAGDDTEGGGGGGSSTRLSDREGEVMEAVVRGLTNKEIAGEMGLSVRTIDHHRERMMRKIGARNAADVVRYAARTGRKL